MARLKLDATEREYRYECEDMEAGLPMHAHAPGSGLEHDVRCVAGEIAVYIHPDTVHRVKEGQTLVFDSTRWHGILPLIPGAVFVNRLKGMGWEEHTVLESPHGAPSWVYELLKS